MDRSRPPAYAVPGGRIDRADRRIAPAVDIRGEAARTRLAGRPDGHHGECQAVAAAVDEHGWATLRREWRDGDRVAVRLPMKFEARPLDASAPYPAIILRGPVALAARSIGTQRRRIAPRSDLDRSWSPPRASP